MTRGVVDRVLVLAAEVAQDLQRVQDRAERRVDLVRDAGGEAAERRQTIGPHQAGLALLELPERRLHRGIGLVEIVVGDLEGGGALPHLILEVGVQLGELAEGARVDDGETHLARRRGQEAAVVVVVRSGRSPCGPG